MRRSLAALTCLLLAGAAGAQGAASPLALPGATAFAVCRGPGTPYPQYALARGLGALWVSCPGAKRLQKIDPKTGRVLSSFRLAFVQAHAIAAGAGAVWAAQRGPNVVRIAPGTGRTGVGFETFGGAYVWSAAGSVWAADDEAHELVRFTPPRRRVRIPTGDGTSAFVASGGRAWIVNHRDRTLERIDLATNRLTRLATLPGDTPERMVLAAGSLWITGRGTGLLRVDPETGAVQATIEIGTGGIDLASVAGGVLVFVASASDDARGLPFAERVVRVDPPTNAVVETIRPTGRLVVDGVVSDGATAWALDLAAGRLYRL